MFLEAIHFYFHLPKHVRAAQHALPAQTGEAPTGYFSRSLIQS